METTSRFKTAIDKIKSLEKQDRYLGAFTFGSFARGEAVEGSDVDVKVVIDEEGCGNINHPFINGVKLDITFVSFAQLEDSMDRQAKKNERVPMIAESIILFDKTGKLKEMKKRYQGVKPKKYSKADHQLVKFMAFHANDKIEKNLTKNPTLALLVMHMNLNELVKMHYQIKGRWYLGAKRIFADLEKWDKPFGKLLASYVRETGTKKKFKLWSKMVDHVLAPIGGRQDVKENNCKCADCKKDLATLL